MVTYPIFGQEVKVGLADYELPPLKGGGNHPLRADPELAGAGVLLAAEGEGQMRFRLVDWEPLEENQSRPAADPAAPAEGKEPAQE